MHRARKGTYKEDSFQNTVTITLTINVQLPHFSQEACFRFFHRSLKISILKR